MCEFLTQAYRPWSAIDDDDEKEYLAQQEVSYVGNRIVFGCSVNGGAEWEYLNALTRWMALRSGRTQRKFSLGLLDYPAPYVCIDGNTAIPVLLDTEWFDPPPDFLPHRVDYHGLFINDRAARNLAWHCIPEKTFYRVSVTHQGKSFKSLRETLIRSGIGKARAILEFVRAEIDRLDILWNE